MRKPSTRVRGLRGRIYLFPLTLVGGLALVSLVLLAASLTMGSLQIAANWGSGPENSVTPPPPPPEEVAANWGSGPENSTPPPPPEEVAANWGSGPENNSVPPPPPEEV